MGAELDKKSDARGKWKDKLWPFLIGLFLSLFFCLTSAFREDGVFPVPGMVAFIAAGCVVEYTFPGRVFRLLAGEFAGLLLFVAAIFFKTPFALLYLFVGPSCFSLTLFGVSMIFLLRKFVEMRKECKMDAAKTVGARGGMLEKIGVYVSFFSGVLLSFATVLSLRGEMGGVLFFVPGLLLAFGVAGCLAMAVFPDSLLLLLAGEFLGALLFVVCILFRSPFSEVLLLKLSPLFCATFLGALAIFAFSKISSVIRGRNYSGAKSDLQT